MRRWAPWLRVGGGVLVLVVVVARVGTAPFVTAVGSAGPVPLVLALVLTAVTTGCCALRWHRIAAGLDLDVPFRPAVGAYYRSQFLNATLPGGVLGDVHRALRHGRQSGERARSAAAVAGERSAGQAVQIALTAAVLLLSPMPVASAVLAIGVLVALDRWPVVVLTSLVASAGHVLVFLVAARAVGIDASLSTLLPIAVIVLLAASIPLNVAGWGPREGAAAWAFASAGLGAEQGAAAAATYGVLALVATLPGAVLLLRGWLDRWPVSPREVVRG